MPTSTSFNLLSVYRKRKAVVDRDRDSSTLWFLVKAYLLPKDTVPRRSVNGGISLWIPNPLRPIRFEGCLLGVRSADPLRLPVRGVQTFLPKCGLGPTGGLSV